METPQVKKTVESTPEVVEASQVPSTQPGTKKRQDKWLDPNRYRTAQFLRLVLWQEIIGSSISPTKRNQ